ncbi:hypothetical protein ACGJEB_000779 [Campylobacter jejuni]
MSFTDFYFDREEKRISSQTKELITNEFESKENLENIFANLQDFKNSLEISVGGKIKCRKRKIKCRIFATNYLSFNLKLKL